MFGSASSSMYGAGGVLCMQEFRLQRSIGVAAAFFFVRKENDDGIGREKSKTDENI